METSNKETKQVWDYAPNKDDKLGEKVAKDSSIVMTNPEMAKYLLSTIPFVDGDVLREPCMGDGAFFDNFPLHDVMTIKYWNEINLGQDYLKGSILDVDYTISNPPFVPRKLFWEFHLRAMATTRKGIYWLINMSALNVFTPNRIAIMEDKGWYLQNMIVVSDKRWFGRYVFCKFGKTDLGMLSYKKGSF